MRQEIGSMPTEDMRLAAPRHDIGEHLTLTAVPRELKPFAETAGRPMPTYKQVYGKLLDGAFEATKPGGQWLVARADLPVIAEAMGLKAGPVRSPKARGAQRAPVATVAS
jgi:hypothetical protein